MASSTRLLNLLSLYIIGCISIPTPLPTASPSLQYIEDDTLCKATFTQRNATYDLCPLSKSSNSGQIKYYKVQDSRTTNTTTDYRYEYYFNVANSLPIIPEICETGKNNFTHKYCPKDANCTNDKNTIEITDNAVAYQVRYSIKEEKEVDCWVIGQGDGEWRLIDEQDPSFGVQLTYLNGDYDDGACKSNRKFNLRFDCEDNVLYIPDEEPLYEYDLCEYTLSVPSQYGCPIECNIFDNQLCNSQGLCGYDNTNDVPRCFCFNEYTGDDCGTYDADAGIPESAEKKVPPNDINSHMTFTLTDADNTGVDVLFDLAPFGLGQAADNGGMYIVHDLDYDSGYRKWTYYVGITHPLDTTDSVLPDFCAGVTGPCEKWNGTRCLSHKDTWSGLAFVYQTNNETKECYTLGTAFPTPTLYDTSEDPAKGVTITYGGGSYCSAAGIDRTFMIHLLCPRDQTSIFDPYEETEVGLYEYVEEESTCIYSFTLETAIACPFQCITNTTDDEGNEAFTVCSGRGICAADPNAGFVRCLCDYGWKGVFCTEIDSSSPTLSPTNVPTAAGQTKKGGFIATIVILVVVVLFVVIAGYFLYRNLRMKINQQQSRIADYEAMEDDDKKGMIGNATTSSVETTTDSTGKNQFATISQEDEDGQ